MTARWACRSDSRPGWPSTACRAATRSHGQSPAKHRGWTVMASAAAALPGRTWWTSKQASTAKGRPCLCAGLLLFALRDGFDRKRSLKARGVHSSSRVKVPKLPFSASYSNERAARRVSAHTDEALRQAFPSDPAGADGRAEVCEGWRRRRGRVIHAGGRAGRQVRAAAARSASVSPVALTSQPRPVAAPYDHILARRARHPASSGLIRRQNTSKSALHFADGKLQRMLEDERANKLGNNLTAKELRGKNNPQRTR